MKKIILISVLILSLISFKEEPKYIPFDCNYRYNEILDVQKIRYSQLQQLIRSDVKRELIHPDLAAHYIGQIEGLHGGIFILKHFDAVFKKEYQPFKSPLDSVFGKCKCANKLIENDEL